MQELHDSEKNTMSEDKIDENLEDSFPASDPPSWNLGTNHRAREPRDENGGNEELESEFLKGITAQGSCRS